MAKQASDAIRRQQRAEALAATLPPLLAAAERVASTVAQGVHGRRRVGMGESFWQFRRYQPGDEVRAIDWRQTAKSRAVFVRELEWEASQSVWLWRDADPSMDYRSRPDLPTKRERSEILLLALASLLNRAGERIALVGGDGPPAAGRANVGRIALALSSASARPEADRVPRHAGIVLLGDFLDPLEEIDAEIASLADRGVRGHILQILDPAEATMPFAGRVRFEDFTGREDPVLVRRVEGVRDAFLARLKARQDGLATLARTAGWTCAVHRTDRPAEAALLSLFTAISGEVAGVPADRA